MKSRYKKLPKQLVEKLQNVEKRLFVIQTGIAIFGAIFGIIISFIILYLSDRLWNTPTLLRLIFTVGGAVSAALFTIKWIKNRIQIVKSESFIPKLIQKHFQSLGDSLQGIIELAHEETRPENISPELCKAAINQVAERTSNLNFELAVSPKKCRKAIIFCILSTLTVAACYLYDADAIKNTWQRWFNPLSNIKRYTFVQLENIPNKKYVPHGEPFSIKLKFKKNSQHKERATLTFANGETKKPKLNKNETIITFKKGITQQDTLTIKVGDYKQKIEVIPIHRPVLLRLQANITLPSYLSNKKIEKTINGTRLKLLAGSSITLSGKISGKLAEIKSTNFPNLKLNYNKNRSANFTTETINLKKENKNITFTWKDIHNLQAKENYTLQLIPHKDEPPLVHCPNFSPQTTILEGEVLPIKTFATDDYGVKDIYMEWQIYDRNMEPVSNIFQKKVCDGKQGNKQLKGEFIFAHQYLKIPAKVVVVISATTIDYYPKRQPVSSAKHVIEIISLEEHSKRIKELFANLQTKVEEVAMTEEQLLSNNKNIKNLNDKELKNSKTGKKIEKNKDSEELNANTLKDITKQGANLLKEALRNKNIPKKTLSKWTKMMEDLNNIANKQMSQVSQSLQQANSQTNNRKQKMNEAIKKQEEIVKALSKISKKMNDSLKNMAMRNFASRLRNAAKMELAISNGVTTLVPKTIGLDKNNLPQELQEQVKTVAKAQTTINKDMSSIKIEIYKYFELSKIDTYNKVFQLMEKAKLNEKLKTLGKDISNNQLATVITKSKTWADNFNKWAKILEDSGGGGGGGKGGGNKPPPSEEEIAVLLKLLEFIQQEHDLRIKTKYLEENKNSKKIDYNKEVEILAEVQGDMARESLKQIININDIAKLKKLKQALESVNMMMGEATDLLEKPQTDAQTVAIESAIIEYITSIFTGKKGKGKRKRKKCWRK